NTNEDEFYPVITASHNLYFTKDSKSGMGKDDIYQCQWDGTQYQQAVLLDAPLNSAGYEFNAYVAPDESFIIYTRYNAMGGFGSGDLYISRKDKIGSWSIPENMGSVINTPSMEYCSFYDFNSQTLYFTSRRNLLTPQKFKDVVTYNEYITKGENGWSKIYQYKIKL
nr:PD40 domain-containing protein [Saprospiraceae bacterium]